MLKAFEYSFISQLSGENAVIVGVDEVGRGALFGSVVASAVALPLNKISQLFEIGVKDSKQLSAKKRCQLSMQIKELLSKESCAFSIASASVEEIDQLNILQASLLAMKRAIVNLKIQPELCLIDGVHSINNLPWPQQTVIKGDRQSSLIAAASILAKVWRDDLIISLATKYSEYDLVSNKGYGTKKHRLALQQYGASVLHRQSFAPCKQLLINVPIF